MPETTPEEDSPPVPAHWTPEAAEMFEVVLKAIPELDGPGWSALLNAAELLTTAGELEALARAREWVSTGYSGQEVLHPAAAEARQCRAVVSGVLLRLMPPEAAGARSQAGRSLARQRWGAAR